MVQTPSDRPVDTRQYRTDQPCGDGNKTPTEEVYNPKATLLGAAQEVFVAQGYHAAAMDDIADRAGVAKGAVYLEFSDKAAILAAVLNDSMRTMTADDRATFTALGYGLADRNGYIAIQSTRPKTLGYALIPGLVEKATAQGYVVAEQARLSRLHLDLIDHGVYPIYREKSQAGLRIVEIAGIGPAPFCGMLLADLGADV